MENNEYKYKNWCVNILFSEKIAQNALFDNLQYVANSERVTQVQHVGFLMPPLVCCLVSFEKEVSKKEVYGLIGVRLRSTKQALTFSVESTTFFKKFTELTGQAAQIINHQN